MNKYKLFYDNILIGNIIQSDENFPNLYGKFEIDNRNLPDYLIDYLNYSNKCSELFEEDEKKWLKYIDKNESKYNDLIESNKWYLTDESGKINKILIPIIGKNDITWRWNI
jgi:hypothetical protein